MELKLKRKRISEANIQAEFYHQCRTLSIPCYLEYKQDTSRFDAVIYDPITLKILIIIEIKNSKKSKVNEETKQFNKYKKFNIPIMVIRNSNDIKEAIVNILRFQWQNEFDMELKNKIQTAAEKYKIDTSHKHIVTLEERLILKT